MEEYTIPLESLSLNDIAKVGGKNASLGEMIGNLSQLGVDVPGGFATTADAFQEFLAENVLADKINNKLAILDVDDIGALTAAGEQIRQWVIEAPFPAALEAAVRQDFQQMSGGDEGFSVAVRSSATAEDLPDASFAGQQETYLNIRGIEQVLQSIKMVYASLYNDRAISYRVHQGFAHHDVSLSAGIQKMVRSDVGSSGVLFTLDTESGFRDVVFITSSVGLGEMVVQGAVNPDEFYIHKATLDAGRPAVLRRTLGSKLLKMVYGEGKTAESATVVIDTNDAERTTFSISDDDLQSLARQALVIEKHYGRPMDVEWAKDGIDGKIYIVQARPETVQSRQSQVVESFQLKSAGKILCEGRSIGQRVGQGRVRVIRSVSEIDQVQDGDVLVSDMTDPDWEPVMKRASAIVTNRGGRTCHAAIIARELGVPAVVGCGNATEILKNGDNVTVSCADGEVGHIYEGLLEYERNVTDIGTMPTIDTKIMMNVGNPDRAFQFACLPNDGIGLARLEFIINNMIGIHPKALLEVDQLPAHYQEEIARLTAGYPSTREFFVSKLVEGIATLAGAFSQKKVIVRMSDFKSNEYSNLFAGDRYEPHEENPMLGYRGASRYISTDFRDCFEMECEALKYVRDEMGFTNVEIMIPFVRTVNEAKQVTELLATKGLKRGENGLRLIMMCELPSNAILADDFLEYFDGFSIGSNDLTQLTLGLDRDSSLVADKFDERNPAVKQLIHMAIQACSAQGKYVGICGQGPSDHPDFAEWLVEEGIDSLSLNPDTVVETWKLIGSMTS